MSTSPAFLEEYIGQSGRSYRIERVFQEDAFPPGRVCLATAGDQKFILKYIHPVNFEDLQNVNDKLRRGGARIVRLAQDIIPNQSMFVCWPTVVLKLAANTFLVDINANNIFIDWTNDPNTLDGVIVHRVQLGDLEDAAHIPPGCNMVGKQAGNWMWRSPEAHARGPVNKPSDIFSGLHRRIIFAVGDDELEGGAIDPLAIVIERQISYFADEEGLEAFLKHLAAADGDTNNDNSWITIFKVIRDGFNQENPRRPFSLWKGVDDVKSLICAMTNFDPAKRITAREALAHKWFDGV